MNGRSAHLRMLAWVAAMVLMAACGRKDKVSEATITTDSTTDRRAIDSARMVLERSAAGAATELAGSTWKLVVLRGPDSNVTAERLAVYTVEFGKDGRVNVVAGCNRGSGTYTVTPPKALSFGPLATTRAMCPPGSISARFLADFPRMRSYQLVAGLLHIELADSGGIDVFEPEIVTGTLAEPDESMIFACKDSVGVMTRYLVSFSGDNAKKVTISHGGKGVTIPQVQSGSGAKYEGSGVMFWNKGRDAMLTWKGQNLNCLTTIE